MVAIWLGSAFFVMREERWFASLGGCATMTVPVGHDVFAYPLRGGSWELGSAAVFVLSPCLFSYFSIAIFEMETTNIIIFKVEYMVRFK